MSYQNGFGGTDMYGQPIPDYYMQRQTQPSYYAGSTKSLMMEQQRPSLKGRPVSSIEEAKASQIDFDGSVFVFPNIAGNEIYTRRFNQDGTVSFDVYVRAEKPVEQPVAKQDKALQYVTQEQLEQALTKLEDSFIDMIASTNEGNKNDGPK